jgi:ABC-type transport system involved in cytochrome c biogenesis permease component
VRWLLIKDLQILRRSPLLVALLVLYPIVISVLIGFALSRGPDKPKVAFLNQVPSTSSVIELSGERIDIQEYADDLFRAIEPVEVDSREEAIEMVEDGDALGALIIPPDTTEKLQSGLEPATVEVFYNAEDPVKARFVQDTIKSQVQDANLALARKFTEISADYLKLIVEGGEFAFLGRDFQVLGLQKSEEILRDVQSDLPRGSRERDQLDEVIQFAGVARDNLSFSDDVLTTVGSPIKVNSRVLDGGSTPLNSFAVAIAVTVSLMFVTLLLASGTLALEREENAFLRLVRGLVSRTALIVEKIGLAAVCSVLLSLLMLVGLALFIDLDWGRFPLWLAGLVAGALAFGAMGVALGAVTREVRAASLLAFMLALPIAFLALVPSGSVAPALYDVVRVVSALFPFKPTLDALNSALNDSGDIGMPLVHLAILALAFGAIGRVALRRFA